MELRLPLMAAPMSIATSRALVSAASAAGILGCIHSQNARRQGGLRAWAEHISADLDLARSQGLPVAPFAINLNLSRHRPPEELMEEIAVCRAIRAPIVTTNAGDPTAVVEAVHDWGGAVIHDATTESHAERAIRAGVDGLMLVCAGAGGLGGLLSPFAFVSRVRMMFDGVIVLAGGIGDGAGIAGAIALGADMVCMGTRFIATQESGAPEGHKQMLTEAVMADVVWTDAICGVEANFLRPSIQSVGLDHNALPPPTDGRPAIPRDIKPWSMVWSGGHSVATTLDIPTTAALVARLQGEFRTASARLN